MLLCASILAQHPKLADSPQKGDVLFREVTTEAGVEFTHVSSFSPKKYLVEIMGSGCAFLDYDRDGWLDILLVNGGAVPGVSQETDVSHALFRNLRNGRFENVTRKAELRGNNQFGMGVAVGDFDNDGWDDLYLTYFPGPNQLYRNNGDGTFTDVSLKAGVGAGNRWSSSAAFFDYDKDGFLDLYVARYANFTYESHRNCVQKGRPVYCSPREYGGTPDLLFHNNRDGTFADVSRSSGISSVTAKGLGVVGADLDADGLPEIYVANDTEPNFLFKNRGNGTFEETALLAGVALDDNGRPQSGMGIGFSDYDRDGRFDLAVTNLATEYLTLYRNLGSLIFDDVSSRLDLKRPTSRHTGFGAGFIDFDNDGIQDLSVVNGHIDDMDVLTPGVPFEQPKLLLQGQGKQFVDVSSKHGAALLKPQLGRGNAFGDYDNDGDIDILVSSCGGRPMLLRNEGGNQQHWLSLQLQGRKSNRNGIGSVVTVKAGQSIQYFQVIGGGSYLSASDLRVHAGLGGALQVNSVEVRWPSGSIDRFGPVSSNQFIVVQEGQGRKQAVVEPRTK
ncbi:MAG: CRTAC1 family protein [Acidobacteria bacterium]|nr:CRTAC1 family protein [Acidobacteriota bacterium]